MSNRERIIDAAIELMNERGASVGTTALATHLGISPGNLYYHFRNRAQILLEIIERFDTELTLHLGLKRTEKVTPERLAECFSGGAEVLYRYRFFFSSALELTLEDAALMQRYRQFADASLARMVTVIKRALKACGNEELMSTREQKRVAENMWVLWLGWPRYAELHRNAGARPEEFKRGLEQIALLLKPYLTVDYFDAVLASLHDGAATASERTAHIPDQAS